MNDKTGGSRGPRRAAALAVVTAVAVLTTGCGVHISFGRGSASGPATYQASLAYAHCMQTHGVPNFPDPKPSERFSISGHLNGNSPLARANDACGHLLRRGSVTAPTTASPPGAVATELTLLAGSGWR